ncbi:MAG: APC family permease [Acidobacteria bacterium]|nr:APC family permease [Acidobacteriota bacterium]
MPAKPTSSPELARDFGLLRATAMNVNTVVGVGPFITIPLMLGAMGGPQALLGWVAGAILAMCDGLVWAELGAAWPGSGGTYRYLREAYGHESWGRLAAFLFIWQFILSGPLVLASGFIGFAQYCTYVWPLSAAAEKLIAAGVGAITILALYRRIHSVGKMTVALGIATIATMSAVVVLGLGKFNPGMAFAFPPHWMGFNRGFFLGLGSAMLIAIYDYVGYAEVCYIGDEVKQPEKTLPRSIILCVLITAAFYLAMEIVIVGVVPWRDAVHSQFVVSQFMERVQGRGAAVAITGLILVTAFASLFGGMLGASRIPYAAARDGYFFPVFARVHRSKRIPHISLLVLGAAAIVASFFDLEKVITLGVTASILTSSVMQILALPLMRRRLSAGERPYRMPLYPLPALVALAGWVGIFVLSGAVYVEWSLAVIAAGGAAFLIHAGLSRTWPFAEVRKCGSAEVRN